MSTDNINVRLVVGDITKQDVDAIVNPANSTLLGGGGADGAIHRTAGPQLLEECKHVKEIQLQSTGGLLPTAQAVITKGYNLPAKHVIHTVGPIYDNDPNPTQSLHDAYTNCLELAVANGIETMAFPSISTGVYGFPIQSAAETAMKAVVGFEQRDRLKEIRFVLFSRADHDVYQTALKHLHT